MIKRGAEINPFGHPINEFINCPVTMKKFNISKICDVNITIFYQVPYLLQSLTLSKNKPDIQLRISFHMI